MFSIKKSYGNCEKCRLLSAPSCILETNIQDGDLSKCDILFSGESPTQEDINNETPFTENTFKKPFKEFIEQDFNYVLTNSVLCLTINEDDTPCSPTYHEVDNCKSNLYELIKICNPKLIVCFGNMSLYTYGLGKTGILKKAYQTHLWEERKIYVMPHPSYINKNGGLQSDKGIEFENGFMEVRRNLGKGDIGNEDILAFGLGDLFNSEEAKNITPAEPICNKTPDKEVSVEPLPLYKNDEDNPVSYRLNDKFYTDEYRLVDIQYYAKFDRLMYVFRDKQNTKIYYEYPNTTKNYYYYESASGNSRMVESFKNLRPVMCNYRDRKRGVNTYESDIDIALKHSVDYYMHNQGEPEILNENILFIDIEVYTFDDRSFPEASKAAHPISLISYALDDGEIETILYKIPERIDPKLDKWIETYEHKDKLTVFTSEVAMLNRFTKRLHQINPDVLTAWNVAFDIGYIYNRMHNLGMNPRDLSRYDDCYVDAKSFLIIISGYIVIDMLTIYKSYNQQKDASNTLEAVSQKHLKQGKHPFSCPWFDLYEQYIDEYIIYNRKDVELIVKLNTKLRHIELTNALRTTATTTWKGASSTIGQAEGLFLRNLKGQGLCMRTKRDNVIKGDVAGAYVKEPVGGKYEWLVDFDYSSLYPNIIRTWNIGPNTLVGKIDEELAFTLIYDPDSIDKTETLWYVEDPIHTNNKVTITWKKLFDIIKENNATINLSGCLFCGHNKEKSIFFNIYDMLLEDRKKFKKLKFQEKDETKKKQYDNKQWSLKILANSLYGVLLNEHFRFYNADLGYSVTRPGKEAIRFAAYHMNNYMISDKFEFDIEFEQKIDNNLKYLLYIDTDSMFLKMGDFIDDKCGGGTITTKRVLNEVAKLDTVVNKTMLSNFVKRHNIPQEWSYLDLKQEIVADRAYFLEAKKRYACHIVNQEGNDVDEIDIKGIETQRSDFSEITKEMLKKIIDMLLEKSETDLDEILDYVEVRKVMIQDLAFNGDSRIGKPVGYGKPLNEYKMIPRGVRGMLLWNHLCYDIFRPGMRGREFPILGVDLSKAPDEVREIWNDMPHIKTNSGLIQISGIKSIVVPDQEEKVPDYFKIDIKTMVSFAVDDRINLLLSPLFTKSNEILTF
jgi:uracil-DNA glycosylase family 4